MMDDTSRPDTASWSHALEGGDGGAFRPFGVHWLDSALQETLLPGTPWEQVEEKVSRGLVSKLRSSQEFKDMEKKQMILQLLGARFVEKYLKDEIYVPNILEPPRITLLKRQQLQRSMQKILKDKLDDVARFHEVLPSTPDAGESNQRDNESRRQELHSVEMNVTQEHMRAVFQKGLNRHLVMNGFTADKARTDNIPDPSVPSMNGWSGTSNLLGHSLCAILQRDPNRLPYICKRLGGKQLPASLREFLWAEVLLRHSDSTVHTEKTTEKSLRKTFAKMVSKGKLELKISKATECPINGLIKKAVEEKYEKTVCMQQHKGTPYISQCSEALNVLYTYNRSYEPYLVHWLFPLQVAFHDMGSELEDHPYELAFYLNLLQNNTFPRWPEIYAIAEQAMARLHTGDAEFYQHLQTCSVTNVKVDPKEFMVQLLEDERKKAASLSGATEPNVSATDADYSKSLLANPVVFLRKWVGEGFVSVLDTQAVLFIWDQCFMSDWNRRVIEDVCLALVLLLRRDFMEAIDYHQMKQVFLLKPCKLYTADIQAAFKHLQGGGAAAKVPDFDRRRSETTDEPTATPEPYNPVPIPIVPIELSQPQVQNLKPVGLTDIHLNLVINQPDIRKAEDEESPELNNIDQLVNFQSERLSVSASLWHKGSKLAERECKNNGVMVQEALLGRENPLNEDGYTKTYQVSFSSDSLVFDDVSLQSSSYDSQDDQPVAMISISYRLLGGQKYLPLGWATLPVYEDQADDATSKRVVPICPGEAPETTSLSHVDPDYKVDDNLQQGSSISTIFIDPSNAEIPSEPAPSPQPDEPLWVPYDNDMGERSTPWKPDQGFDLYIDQVRILPDNATIVMVKARLVKPQDPNISDVIATPLLDSPARCPQFECRDSTEKAEESNLTVFRVYTEDKATKELVALGAAILPLYDEKEHMLNIGGFQLQLHSGYPDEEVDADKAALDKLPLVPGASILVRVLPITKIFIPAPNYASGYYRNSYQTKPLQSHFTVMEHYKRQDNWVETVQDTIEYMQDQQEESEETESPQGGEEEAEKTPQGRIALTEWIIDRLDESKRLPEGVTEAGDLDLTRCVNYDLSKGMFVKVHLAAGVKGAGLYTHAVCEVLPGRRAASLDITSEGYGVVDRFHTKQHIFSSAQAAPKWKDPPVRIHPHYDPQSFLLLRFIGLTLLYNPDPNQEEPGVIKGKHGKKRVQIGPESYLGWTVLPMFDKGCVAQGKYIMPIFQDDTNLDFLEDIGRADNILTWMKTNLKKKVIKLNRQYATAIVSISDGHYEKTETVPLTRRDAYLDVDDFQKFAETAQLPQEGAKICQHILRGLPKEVQDEEMDSVLYQQEEKYFEQLALIVFDEVLENVKELGRN